MKKIVVAFLTIVLVQSCASKKTVLFSGVHNTSDTAYVNIFEKKISYGH